MTNPNLKILVDNNNQKLTLRIENLVVDFHLVKDNLYFATINSLDFAGKGKSPTEAMSNLNLMLNSYLLSLMKSGEIDDFIVQNTWNYEFKDEYNFVLSKNDLKISVNLQVNDEDILINDIDDDGNVTVQKITNPKILNAIKEAEKPDANFVEIDIKAMIELSKKNNITKKDIIKHSKTKNNKNQYA